MPSYWFDNEIGVSQIAMGVAGLGLTGVFVLKHRATNKYFSSLGIVASNNLSRVWNTTPYLSRGPMFVGNDHTPIDSLNLRYAYKAVVMLGANRSGHTIYISNYILDDLFPWWNRFFFPPRGLFLKGNVRYPTVQDWLRSQIPNTGKGSPCFGLLDLLSRSRNEQRVRLFLHYVFKARLPRFLKPQPVVIIVDQAEVLLAAYRANFLLEFDDLFKCARDKDLVRLVLVVNTEKAVKALELVNDGCMFEIVRGPKVSREAVEAAHGEAVAKIFDDCDGCIGVAMDYLRDTNRRRDMTAREYAERFNRNYLTLVDEITRDEYHKAQAK